MAPKKRQPIPMWFGILLVSAFAAVNAIPSKYSGGSAFGYWLGFTATSTLMYWLIGSGLWRGTNFLWISITKAMKPKNRLSVGHDTYDD